MLQNSPSAKAGGDGSGTGGVKGGQPYALNALKLEGFAPSAIVASLLGVSPGSAKGEIRNSGLFGFWLLIYLIGSWLG
jgi:hypothetical protein